MSALIDLEQSLQRAVLARIAAQKERGDFENKLRSEFNAALSRSLREKGYDRRLYDAMTAESQAREALEKEKTRIALEETKHPYPLGTRMVEWEYLHRHSYVFNPADRRLTGKVGILEVITPTSEHPTSTVRSRARPGDLVIRLLKKDGSPSKLYVIVPSRTRTWGQMYWVPEGTDLLQEDLSWPRPDDPKSPESGTRLAEVSERTTNAELQEGNTENGN